MLKEVTLPGIAENVESGEVIAVLVSVGDVVEKDQPVVELETEKAAFEVPSPERGRIAEIDVKVGQTVKVGEVLTKFTPQWFVYLSNSFFSFMNVPPFAYGLGTHRPGTRPSGAVAPP